MIDSVLLAATIVAIVRKAAPAVDGAWVLLVAAGAAIGAALMQHAPDWKAVGINAIVAWIGAVGGVSLVQRLIDRATWPEAPTSRQSPQAKR
jgi:hypothetical protein